MKQEDLFKLIEEEFKIKNGSITFNIDKDGKIRDYETKHKEIPVFGNRHRKGA